MPHILYLFALAAVFVMGISILIQPQRQMRGYMQTLDDIQLAGIDYMGEHCGGALPPAISAAQLQAAGNLANDFNNQGALFTWQLDDHPVVSVNISGNAAYLAFLAGHTLGGFETDGSYSFIPDYDVTPFRAANHSYNLFLYDENDFSCN